MKKKMPIIIASAIAAVGLAGGVVTAYAAINTSKAEESANFTVDNAIYLHFGDNVLGNITDLESPVIKKVVVAAPTGNQATGNVNLTLTLVQQSGEHKTIAGVHVEVSTTEYGPSTVVPAEDIIKVGNLEKVYTNTVSALKSNSVSYFLRISLDEDEFAAAKALDKDVVVSGSLTAALSFAAE